jgi:hypothetical protein
MRTDTISQLVLICFLAAGAIANADMVILQSGELFQTRKAWTENGTVFFYQGSRIVQVKESEVERLIVNPRVDDSNNASEFRPIPAQPQATSPAASHSLDSPPPMTDADAGFLDLKWGMPVSQVDGAEPEGSDPSYGGVALYSLHNRERFGRAHVDRILLGFWRDSLYTITVWTANFLDFRDLKAEAFRRFGEGIQNHPDVERFHWVEDFDDRLLSYDFDSDTGYLWMRSTVVHQQVMANYPE